MPSKLLCPLSQTNSLVPLVFEIADVDLRVIWRKVFKYSMKIHLHNLALRLNIQFYMMFIASLVAIHGDNYYYYQGSNKYMAASTDQTVIQLK